MNVAPLIAHLAAEAGSIDYITPGAGVLIAMITTLGTVYGIREARKGRERQRREAREEAERKRRDAKEESERKKRDAEISTILTALGKVQHQVVNDHPQEPNMRAQSDDRHDEISAALEGLGQGQRALLEASQRQDRRFDGVDQRLSGIDKAIGSVRDDVAEHSKLYVPSSEVDQRIKTYVDEHTFTPDELRDVKARARRRKQIPPTN